jgi:hypothetical protein
MLMGSILILYPIPSILLFWLFVRPPFGFDPFIWIQVPYWLMFYLPLRLWHMFNNDFIYSIFENGFIYPKRLGSADADDNFLAFDRIKDITFYRCGIVCVLQLNDGSRERIDIYKDWLINRKRVEPYLKTVQIIISRLNKTEIPDFSPLRKYLENPSLHTSEGLDITIKEMVNINHKFGNVPNDISGNWARSKEPTN